MFDFIFLLTSICLPVYLNILPSLLFLLLSPFLSPSFLPSLPILSFVPVSLSFFILPYSSPSLPSFLPPAPSPTFSPPYLSSHFLQYLLYQHFSFLSTGISTYASLPLAPSLPPPTSLGHTDASSWHELTGEDDVLPLKGPEGTAKSRMNIKFISGPHSTISLIF